jgi:hypothetical protein
MRGQRPTTRGITAATVMNRTIRNPRLAAAQVDKMGNHYHGTIIDHERMDEPVADIHDYDYSLLLSEETRAAYNAWRNR